MHPDTHLERASAFMMQAQAAREAGTLPDEALAVSKALFEFVAACTRVPGEDRPPTPAEIEAAFGVCRDSTLALRIANATARLGKVLLDIGQPESALRWFSSSEQMLLTLSSDAEADGVFLRTALAHGIALGRLNRFDEAESLLELAEQRSSPQDIEGRVGIAMAFSVLAQRTGRTERVRAILEPLESEVDSQVHPEMAAWIIANLAMLCDAPANRHADAARRLLRSRELLAQQGSEPVRIAEIDQSLALALTASSRPIEAACYAIEALAIDATQQRRDVTWRSLEAVAMAAAATQCEEDFAVLLLKVAIQTLEALRVARADADFDLATLSVTGPLFVYDFLASLLSRQGRFGEARDVVSLKLMASVPPQSPRVPSLTEMEWHAVQGLDRALDGQRREFAPQQLAADLGHIAAMMESAAAQNTQELEALNETLVNRMRDSLPRGAEHDTVIMHIIQSRDSITVIASFDGRELLPARAQKPLEAQQINQLAFEFLQAITTGDSAQRDRCGRQLHSYLIAPAFARLPRPARRLLIAAPGPLHSVPWAALTDGAVYLVEKVDIVRATVPSISLKTPPTAPVRIVACAAGTDSGRFAPLPHTITEAEALNAAVTLIGAKEFTRSGLAAALPQGNILHVASHLRAPPGSIADSRLVLGDGTELHLSELIALGLQHLDLVVLSACESGIAGARELQSSSMAIDHMLLAGQVRAVIGTSFAVDDAATADLMVSFYRHLREGKDKAAALSLAQRAFIRGDTPTDWRAPYFWCAPVLSGNWLGWQCR